MESIRVDPTSSAPRLLIPRLYNATADLVDRHLAEGRGSKIAYIDDAGTLTYAGLAEKVNRAGNALRALGVRMEERVLLVLQDTARFPVVFLGAIKIGAVPVPVNTMLATTDYDAYLKDSRARVAVVSEPLLEKVAPALASQPFLEHVVVDGASEYLALETLLAAASPDLEAAPTHADDVAFWLYTSGSTGTGKGALHVHSSLAATAELYAKPILGIREEDVVFSAAKLFFAYGLGNALTFPLRVGATAVLLKERPTAAAVLRVLHERRPTIFHGVPTLFASLLQEKSFPAHSVRICTSAGEALPEEVGKKFRDRSGADILDGIGSTEMLHIFLSNRPGDVRYGTTGRPVPGYELELRDDSGGRVERPGEVGSLWVSGPSSAIGYWNKRELSRDTFHGRWTRMGDHYSFDENGLWTYQGRSDDMLKVGGIYVSPFEVEGALVSHPEVLEAAVVGARDENQLVKPRALVVLKNASRASPELADELKQHVRARLAHYKFPRWIEFVPELPKTATGKIQRFKLRSS